MDAAYNRVECVCEIECMCVCGAPLDAACGVVTNKNYANIVITKYIKFAKL